MNRDPALSELLWPMDEASLEEAYRWAEGVSVRVLDWMWRSFDQVRAKHLARVDLCRPLEEVERDLAGKHFIELNTLWAMETEGLGSLVPCSEWSELASRPAPPGRSPSYDFAFVSVENQRVAWPLEAKVLPSAAVLWKYMGDVRKFDSGIAAPLVGEGGMVGYLLTGTPNDFFAGLESQLGQALSVTTTFSTRAHRTSRHLRSPAPELRLHHLIMQCWVGHGQQSSSTPAISSVECAPEETAQRCAPIRRTPSRAAKKTGAPRR